MYDRGLHDLPPNVCGQIESQAFLAELCCVFFTLEEYHLAAGKRKAASNIRADCSCTKTQDFHSHVDMTCRFKKRHAGFLLKRPYVSMIVNRVNCPAVLIRVIQHARKGCVFKAEPHTRGIRMMRHAYDGMHHLIQQSAVRND